MDQAIRIPGLDKQENNTLQHARTFKQYVQYVNDQLRGLCSFCELDTNLSKVIRTAGDWRPGFGWRMWQNPYPQKYCGTHLVIAPVRHIVSPIQMTWTDWEDLSALISYAINDGGTGNGLRGGGVLMRFGDPALNAGSIRHIHANIIVPDGTGEVRLPLAKKPEDVQEKWRVINAFEKMRRVSLLSEHEDASPEDLLSHLNDEERALVAGRL